MFGLGWTELIIILAIILIVFGVGKLPEVGAGLGKGIREFKQASRGDELEAAKPDSEEDSEKTES